MKSQKHPMKIPVKNYHGLLVELQFLVPSKSSQNVHEIPVSYKGRLLTCWLLGCAPAQEHLPRQRRVPRRLQALQGASAGDHEPWTRSMGPGIAKIHNYSPI